MNISEVKQVIDRESLLDKCLEYNKQPADIVKWILQNNEAIDAWTRAHIERRKIIDVEKVPAGSSYYINVTVELQKPSRSGESTQVTRTGFQKDEALYNKLQALVGQWACLYVSYNENQADQSVYRSLLDVDKL